MNNIDLARFIATIAWHLSRMVIWLQRGNADKADECVNDFKRALDTLDALEAGDEHDA